MQGTTRQIQRAGQNKEICTVHAKSWSQGCTSSVLCCSIDAPPWRQWLGTAAVHVHHAAAVVQRALACAPVQKEQ